VNIVKADKTNYTMTENDSIYEEHSRSIGPIRKHRDQTTTRQFLCKSNNTFKMSYTNQWF